MPMQTAGTGQTAYAQLNWAGRPVRIEYQWVGPLAPNVPVMVFLHEGLGSVSMWRDFPARLCQTLGCRGLVYSRPGYGQSTPRAADETWSPDFMHRQALEVLPAFLQKVGVAQPFWLLGHSDGGSIALIHAAEQGRQAGKGQGPVSLPGLAGLVVMAPHILVEAISLRSIEKAREAYQKGGLREALARHHADPDSAFWGWNQAWLNPVFANWTIEPELAQIRVPVLAVQGLNDEYGSLEQIRGIARRAPQTRLLELPDCGHSPHRDQPQSLSAAIAQLFRQHSPQG